MFSDSGIAGLFTSPTVQDFMKSQQQQQQQMQTAQPPGTSFADHVQQLISTQPANINAQGMFYNPRQDAINAARSANQLTPGFATATPGVPNGGDGGSIGQSGPSAPGQGVSNTAIDGLLSAYGVAKSVAPFSIWGALGAGLTGMGLDAQMDSIGAGIDSMNANNMAETGMGTAVDKEGNITTFSNPATIAAQDAANFGGYGGSDSGGYGSESGGYGGDDSGGGMNEGW